MHLPIGISNFRKLIEYKDPNGIGYLFVDKSLLIKEIIYDLTEVIVLTRPRRFGKTLNLSMLHHFFAAEIKGQPTKRLFAGLNIVNEPGCMLEQGQHPVIFITFKDAKYPNFNSCLAHIKLQISNIYSEHRHLLQSAFLTPEDQDLFQQILANKATAVCWDESIKTLTKFINKVTGKQAIILIDEYDTPIQEAYLHGYYDQLIAFMRNLLSSALKDNSFVKRAILTGILKISKESLFSGLNNAKTYSVLDQNYSNYFGFTAEEINQLLHKSQLSQNLEKVKDWYNGYNFGGTTIYNPWSIINFIKDNGKLSPHWINTSSNELIKEILITSEISTQEKIGQLIAGETIKEIVDENIIFKDLEKNRAAIWGLFTMSGYLKVLSSEFGEFGNVCTLAIPNKEVEFLYKQIFREWLAGSRGIIWYQELLTVLITGKVQEFEHKLQNAIEEMASFHDTGKNTQEIFYQGLMLGILVGLKDQYEIRSNRESGIGRYDLMLSPKDPKQLGIIMEFKAIEHELNLKEQAAAALAQIKNSKYTTDLKSRGVNNICCMGIAFSGKVIKIVADYPNSPKISGSA